MKNVIKIFLLLPLFVFSQTGPGGVGNSDGSSNLVLWLDASTVSGNNNDIITSWPDQSGNNYNFSDGTGAKLKTSIVNGYSAFRFNGSSRYFEKSYESKLNPKKFTVFSVDNATSSKKWKAVLSNRDDPSGSATAGFILYSAPKNNKWTFWTGRASGSWQETKSNISTAGNWAGQTIEYQSGTNAKKIYIQGEVKQTNTHSLTQNPNRPFRVGAGRNESSPDYYFKGDISEIIMFDEVVNSAQRIIIQNYLSAKYNYTLNNNDLYNKDDASNGDYDHEVAGIGRIDASNLHDDSQGTGIVRINNPSDLGDNEFLIWGHDNGVEQAIETTDVPPSVEARLERVWRVSEVNLSASSVDVGSIDIAWDLSNLGSISSASDLRLLVDRDNDGSFADETPISGAVNTTGNIYKFSSITAISNNLRFTLGTIDAKQTPLPIQLIKFNVKLIDNVVKINWQTASESNNNYFTVQRSIDTKNWETIKVINGAGNTDYTIDYSISDKNPVKGISYYRLKQTDFDNHYSYSKIKTIIIKNNYSQIRIFPNPTKDKITIQGDLQEIKNIKIYNALGQEIQMISKEISENERAVIINLSHLPKGMYLIKTNTQAKKIYKY